MPPILWRSQPYNIASFRKSIVLLCCQKKAKTQNHKSPFVRRKIPSYFGGFFRPVPATNEPASLRSPGDESEEGGGNRVRLPISPSLLTKIKGVWNRSNDRDFLMLWAVCCLAFFGFLRVVAPSDTEFDLGANLNVGDLTVDQVAAPTIIRVSIKQSKTDPFQRGFDLFLGKSGSDLCPLSAILNYLVVRGVAPGPLIVYRDGWFLTRQQFVTAVREALQTAGVDQSKYCGYSFRIGAATTTAFRGMEDSIIKTLGEPSISTVCPDSYS